jgi:hypothetical protein
MGTTSETPGEQACTRPHLPKQPLPPPHYDVPWNYGRYRIVVTRRVTEEEQISVECYESTLLDARVAYDTIMESMRTNMIAYNERVVAVNQAKVSQLDRMIERRGEQVRQLNAIVTERRDWLLEKGLDVSDLPPLDEDWDG